MDSEFPHQPQSRGLGVRGWRGSRPESRAHPTAPLCPLPGCMVRRAVHVALGVLVAWLSVPVVINLLSPTQVMNTSFNPLRIVNTYGAFGRYGCSRPLPCPFCAPVGPRGTAPHPGPLGKGARVQRHSGRLRVPRAPCPGLPTASPRSAQRSSCRAQPAPTPACQTPCGKTMNSSASRVTQGGGHASSPPTTTAWTGSCGSRPSR